MDPLVEKITKRSVDALTPRDRDYFVWDALLKGFGVRVLPSGRKTYIVQYRAGGRSRRIKLGVHGAVTPDEARTLARQALGGIAAGENPAEDRLKDRRAANVAALCDRFLAQHVAHHCKASTQREYERACELFIKPRIGRHRIQDIERRDVADLHFSLRSKPYQANRVLGVLSKMFNLAEIWGLRPDGSNPTRHVQRYPECKRERFLAPEEISRLWQVLDDAVTEGSETVHVAAAFKLLLLTGCRLGEIQFARWSYVRGNRLFLPDAKTGPRPVLLSQPTLDVLARIPRLPDNEFIIAGAAPGQAITDLQRPWGRLRAAAGLDDVRIHDLRHTYASLAAMSGLSLPMIGKLLGHTQPQTTARYAHLADHAAQQAATDVGTLFSEFTARPPADADNVVPLKGSE